MTFGETIGMRQLVIRIGMVLVGIALVGVATWLIWAEQGTIGTAFIMVALSFVAVVLSSSLRDRRQRLQQWLWLVPLVMYFVTAVVVDVLTGEAGTLAFYETVAQVIPILVLALTVELRLLAETATNVSGQAAAGLLTILLLGFGEFFSLRAVATETVSDQAFVASTAALASGFVGLIVGGFVATR